ncbi:MAG TPA: serpin family protein, partial [Candidatus Melainabacteria bacterium]|nr:serpin family protein [Candidatus Melainabacteria bacterium]
MSNPTPFTTAPTATFGMKLLASEAAAKPGENIMISPLSVAVALAMAANGARGNTLAGITSTIGLGDVDQSTSNAAYAELLSELKRDKIGVTLAVANAVFAREGVDFYESFLNANRDSFGARVDVLDFAAPETVDAINGWVGDNTQQKITKLLEEIDPLTIMYLINCVYFKGEWTVKFDKGLTKDQPFTTADGSAKDHPLMYRNADMVYGRGEAYTYISLPFGESKDVRLIAFLPQGDKST